MLVSAHSQNRKLGPGVAATYRKVGKTCPPSCPLLNNGCYAQRGHTTFVERRAERTDDSLDKARGVGFIRHLVSGDWLKPTADDRRVVDRELLREVCSWHRQRSQRFTIGWGYTHAADRLKAAGFGPEHMPPNLQILASCDSKDEAKRLQDDGWRTARVTSEMDAEPGEAYCPVDLAKKQKKECEQNCMTCRLCFGSEQNIVFLKF